MGSTASVMPPEGAPMNPRVAYATKQARLDGQTQLIDAPVLLDLKHGTIRYRYLEGHSHGGPEHPRTARVEKPHEGSDLQQKRGYFYHAKLNDFSEASSEEKEAKYKFKFVCKGPPRAKHKKLFYVTGIGLKSSADESSSYSSGLRTPVWPYTARQEHHIYYSLRFCATDDAGRHSVDDELDTDISKEQEDASGPIEMWISDKATVELVKERISLRTLRPSEKIHIFFDNKEIRTDVVIATFKQAQSSNYLIQLVKMA